MQWLLFSLLTAAVAHGVRKMMREGQAIDAQAAAGTKPQSRLGEAEETIRCLTCGAFVVKDSACGRGDCPQAHRL